MKIFFRILLNFIPHRIYWIKVTIFRPFFERFGIYYFSHTEEKDFQLVFNKFLNFRDGFFVEAGAANGVFLSNTYFLEKALGWRGILIEPNTKEALLCKMNRNRSLVFQFALVSKYFKNSFIEILYSGLSSVVRNSMSDAQIKNHISFWNSGSPFVRKYSYTVPTITLTKLFDQCKIRQIDFLSLDLEGYELEALIGLDFSKYKPKYLFFESLDRDKFNSISKILKKHYRNILLVGTVNYFCY